MEEGNKTNFEKDLSGIFESFEPEPPSRVWDRIEKNLNKPVGTKRTLQQTIVRWSVAASLVVGVASAAIFIRFLNETPENQILSEVQGVKNIEKETNVLDKNTNDLDTVQNVIKPAIKTSVKKNHLTTKVPLVQEKKIQTPEYDFQKTIEERKNEPMLASNSSTTKLTDPKNIEIPKIEGDYSGFDQDPLIAGQNETSLFANQVHEEDERSQNHFANHNNAYLINMAGIAGALSNALQSVSNTTVRNDNSTVVKYKFGLKNIKVSGTKYK